MVAGNTVIIEWGTWTRVERDTLRTGAHAIGAAVELHYLSASVAELFNRVQDRGKEQPPIQKEALLQWSQAFEVPTSKEMELFDPPMFMDLLKKDGV